MSEKRIPPYIGWQTWNKVLEGFKTFMPTQLDRSYFDSLGLSGTQYSQAIGALTFLNLIDEAKRPTARLKRLSMTTGEERRVLLREIVEEAYGPLFTDPGPHVATIYDLRKFLRSQGAKGGGVDKCMTFFISAAKEAGVPLSPQLSGEFGRSSGRRIVRQRRMKPKERQYPTDIPDAQVQDTREELMSRPATELAHRLVDKFPNFDPEWPEPLRERWFEAFQELVKRFG